MSRRYLIFISVLTYLTCYSKSIRAQDIKDINNQYWIDFIPHFGISDAFEFYGDATFRISDNGNHKKYGIRPSIKLQASPIFSIHLGLGLFYNALSDTNNILEIRPWEGLRIGWPNINGLNFKHYLRIEQRAYIYEGDEQKLFLHRARYKLKIKVPLNKKVVQDKTVYLPLAYEWLATADDEFETMWASQSRGTAGIGYVFNKKWIFEFEYMHWWSKNTPNASFEATDQIFRLRLLRNGWTLGE